MTTTADPPDIARLAEETLANASRELGLAAPDFPHGLRSVMWVRPH